MSFSDIEGQADSLARLVEITRIHYITQGKGNFYYKDKKIALTAGDFFLLRANELTFYQADQEQPWSYSWVGLSGSQVDDYLSQSTIGHDCLLKASSTCQTQEAGQVLLDIITLVREHENALGLQLKLHSLVYQLLYKLVTTSPMSSKPISRQDQTTKRCKQIIDTQYNDPSLTIQGIADTLGINRSHLTKIFKATFQLSPQQYLLQVRMRRASHLLKTTQESIKVVALSVGYKDPLHFSKAFRQVHRVAPRDYR